MTRTSARLAATMEGGAISVARSLGLSQRRLQRRLADEGTRFNDLVDEVRRHRPLSEWRGSAGVVAAACLAWWRRPRP